MNLSSRVADCIHPSSNFLKNELNLFLTKEEKIPPQKLTSSIQIPSFSRSKKNQIKKYIHTSTRKQMDFIPNLIKYNRQPSFSLRFNYEGNRGTSAVSLLLKKGEGGDERFHRWCKKTWRNVRARKEGRKEGRKGRKRRNGRQPRERRCLSQIRPVERGRWL